MHQEYDEEFPVMYSMSRGTPSAGMPNAGGPSTVGSFLSAISVSRKAEKSAKSSISQCERKTKEYALCVRGGCRKNQILRGVGIARVSASAL